MNVKKVLLAISFCSLFTGWVKVQAQNPTSTETAVQEYDPISAMLDSLTTLNHVVRFNTVNAIDKEVCTAITCPSFSYSAPGASCPTTCTTGCIQYYQAGTTNTVSSITVPANTHAVLLLDQSFLTDAYPTLEFSKGKESVAFFSLKPYGRILFGDPDLFFCTLFFSFT